MDAEMIEKVAIQMHAVRPALLSWRDEWAGVKDYFRRQAEVAIAALSATPQAAQVPDHVRKLVGRIDYYRLRMSYNESYFGEPAGLLKGVISELASAVNAIYPSGNTTIYANTLDAPQPQAAQVPETVRADLVLRVAKAMHARECKVLVWDELTEMPKQGYMEIAEAAVEAMLAAAQAQGVGP